MIRNKVHVDTTEIDALVARAVVEAQAAGEELLLETCQDILDTSAASAAFEDDTGTLRTKGKIKKIKDGYRVGFFYPTAHLVAFGHALVKKGHVVGWVPPHDFFTPAVDDATLRLRDKLNALSRGREFSSASGMAGFGWSGEGE